MGTRVNVDTFYYGPRYTSWLWTLKRRHPLAYLKNRMEWYYYPKRHVVPVFPLHVDFEVSSLCNMTCPMCFRSRSEYDPSLFGNMSLEIFKKGIDECVKYNLYSIRLSWKGECTVNLILYVRSWLVKHTLSLVINRDRRSDFIVSNN